MAVFDNERCETEENRRIFTTASDRNVLNLAEAADNCPFELVELRAES